MLEKNTESVLQKKENDKIPEAAADSAGADVSFIKEKVKERPINRKKLLRRTVITAMMAVVFGLIACFTFLVLEPVFSNWLYPEEEPELIRLQEESVGDEMLPEDMVLEEEPEAAPPPTQYITSTVVQRVDMEIGDYQQLYRSIYAVVQEVSKSMVTVIGVTSETDWFNNEYESKGQTAGLIVADNGKELLILTEKKIVDRAEELRVSFCDQKQAQAVLKQTDPTTGLAVVSVNLADIAPETWKVIAAAKLGSSTNHSLLLGSPILAVGQPMGTANSVAYGMISSAGNRLNWMDGNYQVLHTDIYGSLNGSGVLLNLNGQVIGIISQANSREDARNIITALGISDLRNNIEKLSNGQPMARMGIYGTDVPKEIQETLGVPQGAYVTGIEMDSPAMEGGIQSGDVIVKIGTEGIRSFADYNRVIMSLTPDSLVTLTIMRQTLNGYQEMAVDAVLGLLE